MDEGSASTGAVLILAVLATTFLFLGWALTNLLSWNRWRRLTGVVSGKSVDFVLENVEYTKKTGREKKKGVELSAMRYDSDLGEHIRVSVEVPAETDIATALDEIQRSGAVQVTIAPFTRGPSAAKAKDEDA